MKIQGMSFPALAKLSGTPESTLKKLARGESEDPRLSSVQPAFKVLGLSIDRACGLAPERDMEKEAAQHNVSMATALQERLVMQEDKVSALKDTIAEQKAEIASLKATAAVTEKRVTSLFLVYFHNSCPGYCVCFMPLLTIIIHELLLAS